MSSFRQMLASDIGRVFMNPDEFGEEISLDGQTVLAVVDHAPVETPHEQRPGLRWQEVLIYLATGDLPAVCQTGAEIAFNGDMWIVMDRQDAMYCSALRLQREVLAC